MARLAEQDRARHAFDCVQGRKDAAKAGDYRQFVRGLPAMVQQCGLGQTMAFLASKRGGEHGMALLDLESWLGQWLARQFPLVRADKGVLAALMDGDGRQYRMATAEALAYLGWLKRFAEAAIGKPEK